MKPKQRNDKTHSGESPIIIAYSCFYSYFYTWWNPTRCNAEIQLRLYLAIVDHRDCPRDIYLFFPCQKRGVAVGDLFTGPAAQFSVGARLGEACPIDVLHFGSATKWVAGEDA